MKSAVRISHLSKNFGEQVVLNDVSLDFASSALRIGTLSVCNNETFTGSTPF